MNTFKRVAGFLLIIAAIWAGAYGQELTGGINPGVTSGPYAWPAFMTASLVAFVGFVLIMTASID